MNVICGKCGKEYQITGHEMGHKCPHCSGIETKTEDSTKVKCPKCNSESISTNRRGWKLTTGFLFSSKMINTCQHCGYQWNPKWTPRV